MQLLGRLPSTGCSFPFGVCEQIKTIRFGQQGKTGDKTMTKRAKSFKARHAKNIAKGKMSAAYWANRVKW